MAERIAAGAPEGRERGDDDREGVPDTGWPLLVETGLVGLRLPADAGGGASSAVEVAVVAEALGRHANPGPFIGPVLAGDLLASAAAPADLLEAVATGQRRLTIALDRSLSGPGGVDGDANDSDGRAIGWDSRGAESLVGLVREPDGTVRVAISPGTGPALASSDLTRQLVEAGAAAPTVVGDALTRTAGLRWEALGLVLLCADMVGAMTGSLELAVAYAKEQRPVQTAHRLIPGHCTPGRRPAREHRSVPQRHLLRRLGRRRAGARGRTGGGADRQGLRVASGP